LRRLNISVPINDADLIHVEGLTELRELDLGGTAISDAGLEHLRFLKQLRYLGIWRTKVSDAGVKKLQQALPKCKITR
jgi:Leucine-rich repeat (LRR) protein